MVKILDSPFFKTSLEDGRHDRADEPDVCYARGHRRDILFPFKVSSVEIATDNTELPVEAFHFH